MGSRCAYVPFSRNGYHKGFYNESDTELSLGKIKYTDFEEIPNDEFPIVSAHCLLCGACNIFALALRDVFGYQPYIIEQVKDYGFHAFCQKYNNGKWLYVDARGVTSSFDELMDAAKMFVHGEYIIRPVTIKDENDWKEDTFLKKELEFAKYVIENYPECYII